MIATQDNTILIDFDTYTFHKGDKITLSYYNPFYINVDNAPDVQSILQTSESNTCGMVVVPKDTLLWNNQDMQLIGDDHTLLKTINIPYKTALSDIILQNVHQTSLYNLGTKHHQNYFTCYSTSNTNNISSSYAPVYNPCLSSKTVINSNICYTQYSYAYMSSYNFPYTRSITLYMSSTQLSVYVIPSDFDIEIYESSTNTTHTITIKQGEYTTSTFHNLFYDSISAAISMYRNEIIYTSNKYYNTVRYICNARSGYFKIISNNNFDMLFGRLHCFHSYDRNYPLEFVRFVASAYPTVRSLHIPEGIYTADQLVNYINNNNVDSDGLPYTMFTAESNNNTIYIHADKPFIFNPAMTFHNDTTDLSTTFATSHTLAVIPQQRETFNITFKNHTLQGTYSPAEFLRAVRDLTGCSFYINKFDNLDNVHGYISNILCDQHFDIDCSYFKFTNELSNGRYRVYNKVNLNRMNKQINITNTFLQSGINEYTPITQSSIFTIQPSNEMQNSGLLRIINKDNNTVLTTAIDDHMYNCTHSCGISIYPYQYCSLSGRMLCTFSSAGDITYSCGSENYAYHAISSGTHTICVNSPCRPYNNLYVQGNVKCDFTEVSVCANNVPIINN